MDCDLIITGRYVIESAHSPPLEDGALVVSDGRILEIGPAEALSVKYTARKVLENRNGIVAPGLVNAHTHAPMVLFRGIADDLPLKQWLEEHIFPREAKLDQDLVRLGTLLACAEMIRGGTTSFVDMYFFEEVMAEAAAHAGLRGWYGEGLFDFPSPSFPDWRAALDATRRNHEIFSGNPLAEVVVAPHTPYTCSTEVLENAAQTARELEVPLIIHVSETAWEVEEIRKNHGKSPVGYLDAIGLLGANVMAIHGVHLSQDDMELMADRGVSLCHCPESNLKLGSGICPTWDLMEKGVNVCLGTDGAASNNDLDMLGEMDFAAKLPKGVKEDSSILPASEVLAMATLNGATALGRDDIGRLSPGCQADVMVVDLDRAGLAPCYNPVSHLVYAAKAGDVRHVLVAGRLLMEDYRLLTLDEAVLVREAEEAAKLFR